MANTLGLMTAHDWRDDLLGLFAARANPVLHREALPHLAQLADQMLPDPSGYDTDLSDLIRFAVSFTGSLANTVLEIEVDAQRKAGAAFLHAGAMPSIADRDLIAQGNGADYNGDHTSKRARDTWAYMVYKRAKQDDRRRFYSYKSGADLRGQFGRAVVDAVEAALSDPAAFAAFAREQQIRELNVSGLDFADKQQGVASTQSRIDRSDARDVNFPDGTLVPLGTAFTKTWEVRNIGQVPWIGRRLTRQTPQGPTFPSSADWITIPDTFPGQSVLLSVDFVSARVQGFSEVRFKMTDEHGTLYFPSKYPHGLTLLIETAGVKWISKQLP